MALFGRRRRGADTTSDIVVEVEEEVVIDLSDRSPRSGLLWKDLMTVSEVMDSGVDLSQPRNLRWVVYFDTKKVADKAATRGRRGGYVVDLAKPENGSPYRWRATFDREAVLELREIIAGDDFFQEMVGELGGHLDGLEVKV
jgi:hypothetical protein